MKKIIMTILIGTAISISASAQTARVDDRSPEIQKLNPAVSPPVTIGNPVAVSTNTPGPAAKPAVTQYDSKTVRQPANKPSSSVPAAGTQKASGTPAKPVEKSSIDEPTKKE